MGENRTRRPMSTRKSVCSDSNRPQTTMPRDFTIPHDLTIHFPNFWSQKASPRIKKEVILISKRGESSYQIPHFQSHAKQPNQTPCTNSGCGAGILPYVTSYDQSGCPGTSQPCISVSATPTSYLDICLRRSKISH